MGDTRAERSRAEEQDDQVRRESATPSTAAQTEDARNRSTVSEPENPVVIDLRDPTIAGGLAEALDAVVSLSERAGAAEARAEIARNERMAATGQLRRVTSDLEQEQAERHRLEIDVARFQTELKIRDEQLEEARSEVQKRQTQLQEVTSSAERATEELRVELARTERLVHILEALVSRRKRRVYERLARNEPLDN